MNITEFESAVCDYFSKQPENAAWGKLTLGFVIGEELFENTIVLDDGTTIKCEEEHHLDKNENSYISVYAVEKRDTETQFFKVSMYYDSWNGMSSTATVQEVVPVLKTVTFWHQKN